jgi:hypothetical protein
MAAGREVAGVGLQSPLRLNPENGVRLIQKLQQAAEIRRLSRVNQIDVVGLNRRAIQDRGHAANHDELNFSSPKIPEDRYQPISLHSVRESPGCRRSGLPKIPGAPEALAKASSG